MNNKKTLTIYVLTHCESCYNRRGIFTGRVDSKLSPEGHKHAERLAKDLARKQIDLAFTSPLTRTRETLKHIKKYHPRMQVVVDDRLIERDYGTLSRKSKQKYKREHPDLYLIYHRSYNIAPPGGESMRQVEKRVLSFIKDVVNMMRRSYLNVLIVAHGNSIRPIRKFFEHLTNEQMMKLENMRHIIFRYQIKIKK
jgi:2,3-bisphosphoglycerate-dependent phosphoglycerate mutase